MFTYTHYTIYNKWSLDIKTVRCDWAVLLNMNPKHKYLLQYMFW